ncbi:hypothetical protein OIU78_028045 [Salix suchowensis]|nr:hypothetical protein OIU78_028045 [Salix suchowensis]
MANPSGTNNQDGNQAPSSFNGNNPSNGNSDPYPGSSMKHNPGISTDWTFEEQTILEEGLLELKFEFFVVFVGFVLVGLFDITNNSAMVIVYVTRIE